MSERRRPWIPAFAGMTVLILICLAASAAEPSLKQTLATFGAVLKDGVSIKDLEVMRVEITARASKGTPPPSVADELATIGAVQDLWDIIIHGWTCRNFTAHEVACVASVAPSMQLLGLAIDDTATPETMLRDALRLIATKNERSLADLARN